VQERDGWCWAAVDKSIIQYYKGSSPSQSTLAYTYDSGSPLDGATLDQANSALNGNGIRSSRQYNSLSYSGVQWQINNRHLIFARVTKTPILGPYHALLVRGYDTAYSSVLYIDPADGQGHSMGYSNFNGSYQTWDGSIFDTGL
jgi:hypothetical protein